MLKVYQKLTDARVQLQGLDFNKSGKNGHLGFNYFELKDFIPAINNINQGLGLLSVVDFPGENARIRIIDTESGETLEFLSPTAKATLKGGATPVQELGSMHTYMRRYMYMLAYEILEVDAQDAQLGKPKTKEEIAEEKRLEEEAKARKKAEKEKEISDLRNIAAELQEKTGVTDDQIKQYYGDLAENLDLPELRQCVVALRKKEKQLGKDK